MPVAAAAGCLRHQEGSACGGERAGSSPSHVSGQNRTAANGVGDAAARTPPRLRVLDVKRDGRAARGLWAMRLSGSLRQQRVARYPHWPGPSHRLRRPRYQVQGVQPGGQPAPCQRCKRQGPPPCCGRSWGGACLHSRAGSVVLVAPLRDRGAPQCGLALLNVICIGCLRKCATPHPPMVCRQKIESGTLRQIPPRSGPD